MQPAPYIVQRYAPHPQRYAALRFETLEAADQVDTDDKPSTDPDWPRSSS